MAQFANLRKLVEMVEQGATEGDIQMSSSLMAVAESINIAMIIAVMHDHTAGEDKLIDLLEEEIVKWKKLNVAGYADLSEAEQDDLSRIVRGYCFDHKIDNLGKAIVRGLGDFCTAGEFLPTDACGKTRHTPPKATTWIHACHKLIGRKHGKAGGETTNINTDFRMHLQENDLHDGEAMLDSLGPLVGCRFWANMKTAALLYGLAPVIVDYLTNVCPALHKIENQHNHSVRTLATFMLDKNEVEMIERNKARVLMEVKCMGIWHFALMVPALMLTAKGMTHFKDQQWVIKAIHAFIDKVANDKEFARTLMTEHISPVSFVNHDGASPFSGVASDNQRLAYQQLCKTTDNDEMCLQMLQWTATAMIKTNFDMSANLVLGEQQQDIKSMRHHNMGC